MKRGAVRVAARVALLLCVLLSATARSHPARAQEPNPEPNRAGLVVVKGDGEVISRCVEFSEESISGYDLIAASGVAFSSEAAAMGATICSLDGEGCSSPQESCFCQCKSSPCVYWSYWLHEEDGWSYSNLGAANQRVRNGELQGWVWGAGTSGSAPEPPEMRFADVCAAPSTAPEAAPEVALAATPQPAGALEAVSASEAVPAALPAEAGETAAAGAEQNTVQRGVAMSWIWLGAALLVPLLLFAGLQLRRGSRSRPRA